MLHVSEDTFYADLLQFDQPMPQLRVMQALEQDILVLLRSAHMASAGDSTDTLGADAGDLLLAVEMDFYKYLPVYTSDPSYQDGDHREASLRHLFKCRRMDHLRRQTRQQQYIGYHPEDPLGDEDGITRGSLLADPALARKAKGGPGADRESLRGFHDQLYHAYLEAFGSQRNTVFHMKELWSYLSRLFEGAERPLKQIRKAADSAAYESAVDQIFRNCPLRRSADWTEGN